ncbi:MAG: sodium/proline symporter [Lachnospira sp.]
MTSSQIIILLSMIVYLAVVIFIGFMFTKANKSASDFYLGGRKLGPFVTAMSAEASDMSSYLLMGVPGVAYLSGIANAGWTAIGLIAGTYLNWLIVAKRLRKFSKSYDAITLPEFFSKRFGDKKHIITFISAVVIIIFFIPYTASGFAACGKLFSSLFGMNYFIAMVISAVVIVTYCTLGGFLAASTSDLIQSIVMTVALIIVVVFGINTAGGIDVIIENSKALPGYLDMFETYSQTTDSASKFGIFDICTTLAWGLGYFGMPHVLLRFMAIEDENKLKLSRRIATVWVVISLGVAVFIGIVGYSMSKAGAIDTLVGTESETVIIKISQLIATYGPLASIVAGVILAGILAATMSTADSQLLASASSISKNLMEECFNIKMSEKKSMLVARLTVVVISCLGIVLASNPDSSVFDIVSFAWAGFGAAFGPVMLCSLFWKRCNKYGIIAGMISGGAMIFIWKYVIARLGGVFEIYELLPAFIFATIVIIVVSLLTGKPEDGVVEEYEKALK